MGAANQSLLYYAKSRWLSKDKVARLLITLRAEAKVFLESENSSLAVLWSDKKWVQQVSYMADILDKLNELNMSLQGRNTSTLNLSDKTQGF